ncbi:hypothetical protein JCM15519_31480 [Fundidesulfovibrio butyratiphilus]
MSVKTLRRRPRKKCSRPLVIPLAALKLAFFLCVLPGCAASKKACADLSSSGPPPSCSSSKLFAFTPKPKTLTVRALAYTAQSVGRGKLPKAANGQTLTPDIAAIAVSPDLLEHGLVFDKKVRIEGLDGEYTVMDTMSPRHENTIDIYFGHDMSAARQWGSRELTISWE